MEDLNKVSSLQLYAFWKNLSIGLMTIVVLMALSIVLPFYFSPIVALIAAAFLYTVVYNRRMSNKLNCVVTVYSIFISLVVYSFFSIILNILYVWGLVKIPEELSFFADPYIPSLLLCPVCFLTISYIYLRRKSLRICIDCKIEYGGGGEKGKLGRLLTHESHFQLRNLIALFGILSAAVWVYYLYFYIDTDINNRDWYVFVWLIIIAFLLDEFYFMSRYYNLYLDFKENNEIITPEELSDMTAKTYIRYYVICGEDVLLTNEAHDSQHINKKVIDTPFFTKRSVNGITIPEVTNIIKDMSGVKNGELKFFFGRKLTDLDRHSLLRYFYYLDGKPEDYPELLKKGYWMPFTNLKRIYSFKPGELSNILVSDITRLATIILTQKLFDENGFRKNKLKSYHPTFTLQEIRKNNYDLQDDKWIRISLFNSDTRLYRFKRWVKQLGGYKNSSKAKEWN